MEKEDMFELREIMQDVSNHDTLKHKIELICKTIELAEESEKINNEIREMSKKEEK